MAKCRYCGQDAGFFSSSHKACEEKHQQGMAGLLAVMHSYFCGVETIGNVLGEIATVCRDNFLSQSDIEDCAGKAIEQFADTIALPITKLHLAVTETFLKNINASRAGLNKNGALDKLAIRLYQGVLISHYAEGVDMPKVEKRLAVVGRIVPIPSSASTSAPTIMLGAGETIVWNYPNVKLYEETIEKEWVGRSSGFSFRVMKGVRYHTGGSRGHAVEHSTMKPKGTGNLILTNKNLIFYSPEKSIKVPYKKILSLVPYIDGVDVQRDGANAKRLTFQGFDCWFMMNALPCFIN